MNLLPPVLACNKLPFLSGTIVKVLTLKPGQYVLPTPLCIDVRARVQNTHPVWKYPGREHNIVGRTFPGQLGAGETTEALVFLGPSFQNGNAPGP